MELREVAGQYGSSAGYGSGDGDGYGYGYGYGYGSGDGSGYLLLAESIGGLGALFWCSDNSGLPCNGGFDSIPVHPGLVQTHKGPVELCQSGYHATADPSKWKGGRIWIVKLEGDIQTDGTKSVGRVRTIIAEWK